MNHRKATYAFLALSFAALSSCSTRIVASMYAQVTGGGTPVVANINFTDFQSATQNGDLVLTFSSLDGNSLTLTLAPSNDGFPLQTYTIDGTSGNGFSAKIVVTQNLTPVVLDVTSTNGFINLQAINIQNNVLKSVKGQFKADFTVGGQGQGTFSANAQ